MHLHAYFEKLPYVAAKLYNFTKDRKVWLKSSSSVRSKRTHDPTTHVRSWQEPGRLCGDSKLTAPSRNQTFSTSTLTLCRLRAVLSDWDTTCIWETFSWWLPRPSFLRTARTSLQSVSAALQPAIQETSTSTLLYRAAFTGLIFNNILKNHHFVKGPSSVCINIPGIGLLCYKWKILLTKYSLIQQGANPGSQFAEITKFCKVVPIICGS
jgi:hypothetical protein